MPLLEDALAQLGLKPTGPVHVDLATPHLVEAALKADGVGLTPAGAIVAKTAPHTGRSPKDKWVVDEPSSREDVDWGAVNQAMPEATFDALVNRVTAYLQGKELFVRHAYAGADPSHRVKVRVINQRAWHNLFAKHLFIEPPTAELANFEADFTILHAPGFQADPARDGTRSSTFVALHFGRKLIVIGGTEYAGEVKKSIFTVMNYLLPKAGVMSMHCGANQGPQGDVALFFGLSGTGKTTLSADPERPLIGDDEHGWGPQGVFNVEGGCYAKTIRLSATAEPEIWGAAHTFGSVLENVDMDPATREVNWDSEALTENTRVAYPIDILTNTVEGGQGGHPKHVVMLTADAYGVLPPIAKLSPEQAMYHFLSGYTAKVAGTERGVKEPTATFSACFGAPFMVHKPQVYAKLLGELLTRHGATCWLVNTGWSGGPYGVGQRMPIAHTRRMLSAAMAGELDQVAYRTDGNFGLQVPVEVPGVPSSYLDPRGTWKDGKAYDEAAAELAARFHKNFASFEAVGVDAAIAAAGPKAPVTA